MTICYVIICIPANKKKKIFHWNIQSVVTNFIWGLAAIPSQNIGYRKQSILFGEILCRSGD